MAGKRGAGEGTFWKKSNGRWYGKRRIGTREAVVTINASGATLAGAKADLRAKVEQHLRSGQAPIDATATLAHYLEWWVDEELAERVADGTIVSTAASSTPTRSSTRSSLCSATYRCASCR